MFQQSLNECLKHSKLYCEQSRFFFFWGQIWFFHIKCTCHSSSKSGSILYYNCKIGMKIANFEIADQHMNAKWVKAQ